LQNLEQIVGLLSQERFASYAQPGEDVALTLRRLQWNITLCEALYPSLHWLEIGLRNQMFRVIGEKTNRPEWLLDPNFLSDSEREQVGEASRKLKEKGKTHSCPYLISELKFGFWTALADSRYETLWRNVIRDMFPYLKNSDRTRQHVSKYLNRVRRLRNAASHHHSVWHWPDLAERYEDAYRILEWINPDFAAAIKPLDRFPAVLQMRV
jgi:hypothetical protein